MAVDLDEVKTWLNRVRRHIVPMTTEQIRLGQAIKHINGLIAEVEDLRSVIAVIPLEENGKPSAASRAMDAWIRERKAKVTE